MEYITISLVLIVVGLMLSKWQPPIQKQYQFITLAIVGIVLGYYTVLGVFWGFIISGLVFYKGEVVEEFRLIKGGLTEIKGDK